MPREAKPGASHEEVVVHGGQQYRAVKEGLAYILTPAASEAGKPAASKAQKDGDAPQQVFYNPIQQFNRDLSVLAIKAYGVATLEKKREAFLKRMETYASKKRKRQEEKAASEPPSKMEKLSGPEGSNLDDSGATAPPAANGSEAAPQEVEVVAEPEGGGGNAPADAQKPGNAGTKAESRGPRIKILDALSATGLRALRYAHELPFPVSVTANDLLSSAVESIKLNVEYNQLGDKITVTRSDAVGHMYSLIASELARTSSWHADKKTEKYDVIDLDPYGTAATFFDAAVQAVRDDGGLLCVTCTDAGVWASQSYPEKAFSLYGGVPMKGSLSHEAGLRIILHGIASAAARYGLAIEPQLSLSIDFYCRLFIRVKKSPASVKFQAGRTMVVYNCDQGCGAWTTQPLMKNREFPNSRGTGTFYKHGFAAGPTAEPCCAHCATKTHLAGPMYAGPIHSTEFIQRILDQLPEASTDIYGTTDRIRGMLQTALEEIMNVSPADADADGAGGEAGQETSGKDSTTDGKASKERELAALDPCPFFFLPANLAKTLHCSTPNEDAVRGALRHLGYRVTRSHCKPGSIKTNAPWSVIWEVMREWVRQKAPVKKESIKPGTAAYKLLKIDEDQASAGTKSKAQESQKPEVEVVFDEKLGRERNKERLVRYQVNPRENWGPMNRAKGH